MLWIILLIVLVAAGVVVTRSVLKHRYVKELEAHGWTFVDRPALSIAHGLNNPPFGYGTERSVDDQIVGTTAGGTSFQAFRYRSSASRDGGYVVAMRLPQSYPEFYIFPPDRQRSLIQGVQLASSPWFVVAEDERYGQRMLSVVNEAVQQMGRSFPVDLSVDHDQLVAINAPRKAEELRPFVEALAQVQHAIASADLSGFRGEPAPGHLSFYRRSSWVYEPRNDGFLSYVTVTGGGKNHEALNVVHSPSGPLPFIALEHRWQTESRSTDSEGRTTTTTHNHSEQVFEFHLPFAFRPLGLNRGRGERVRFESTAFNKAFAVRAQVPRFASDVMHPRQLEYVMRTRPYDFEITDDNRMIVSVPSVGPDVIDFVTAFAHGFFGRVPDFTWKELGAWPRPVPEVEDYNA